MRAPIWKSKALFRGFPGGTVVESPPADAGNASSCLGPGGSHMPRSGWAREPWPLSLDVRSLCSATGEATTVRGQRTAKKKKKNPGLKQTNTRKPWGRNLLSPSLTAQGSLSTTLYTSRHEMLTTTRASWSTVHCSGNPRLVACCYQLSFAPQIYMLSF